jgi:hypothetical protein
MFRGLGNYQVFSKRRASINVTSQNAAPWSHLQARKKTKVEKDHAIEGIRTEVAGHLLGTRLGNRDGRCIASSPD